MPKTNNDKKPIAIITADWHTAIHAWRHHPTLRGDAIHSLKQIVNRAKELEVPIIAAGDLFDNRSPKTDILMLTAELLHDVNGCYVQGNHEKVSPPWMKLAAPHWNHLTAGPVALGYSWDAYGIDYVSSKEALQSELNRLADDIYEREAGVSNLLVLHQGAQPIVPVGAYELEDGMIPDIFDYVVIGHIHEASRFSLLTDKGRTIGCLSPGSIHLQATSQPQEKYMFILCADNDLKIEKLETRDMFKMNICGYTESEVQDKVKKLISRKPVPDKNKPGVIAKPIVHITADETTSDNWQKICESALSEIAHLFYSWQEKNEDGIVENNEFEEIDVARHAESGFHYAKDIFQKREPDARVRSVVEAMLLHEPDYHIYEQIKSSFL